MKRVTFIPGFEGMSGILAGRAGKLVYPSNDNKAFDAPNGRQYARNYGSRIVLARRKSDGLAYFACKTKSATLISAQSKTNMAILGSIKPIVSALKSMSSVWLSITRTYKALVAAGQERVAGLSLEQYVENGIRAMLKAKNSQWGDAYVSAGSTVSFLITSPYYLNGGQNRPQIKQYIWNKFFPYLATTSVRKQDVFGVIKIDGTEILVPYSAATGTSMPDWSVLLDDASFYKTSAYGTYTEQKGLTLQEVQDAKNGVKADPVQAPFFNDMRFYKPTSQTAEVADDVIVADTAYTTIRPESE